MTMADIALQLCSDYFCVVTMQVKKTKKLSPDHFAALVKYEDEEHWIRVFRQVKRYSNYKDTDEDCVIDGQFVWLMMDDWIDEEDLCN